MPRTVVRALLIWLVCLLAFGQIPVAAQAATPPGGVPPHLAALSPRTFTERVSHLLFDSVPDVASVQLAVRRVVMPSMQAAPVEPQVVAKRVVLPEALEPLGRVAPKIVPAPPRPQIPRLPGEGPIMAGELVRRTARVDLYVGVGSFSADQIYGIAPTIEWLLSRVEYNMEKKLNRRVSLGFYRLGRAPSRGTRGIAYTSERRAEVYYNASEELNRSLKIVAHELAHHVQYQYYGEAAQRRADLILLEGMATWSVGKSWYGEDGAVNWPDRARQIYESGVPLNLLTAPRYGTDASYELWASFISYIVTIYGWETMDALYLSSRGRAPGSADYQGVTGKTLTELSNEWRAWVMLRVKQP